MVERAREGDRDAIERIIRAHQAWIYNIAVRMLHDPDEAAEFIYYLAVNARYLTGAVIPFDGGFLLGAHRVGDMPKGILE